MATVAMEKLLQTVIQIKASDLHISVGQPPVVRHGGHVTWIGNSEPVVELQMQELVSKELVLRGAYGFVDEFDRAAEAIADRRIDVRPLIERVGLLPFRVAGLQTPRSRSFLPAWDLTSMSEMIW